MSDPVSGESAQPVRGARGAQPGLDAHGAQPGLGAQPGESVPPDGPPVADGPRADGENPVAHENPVADENMAEDRTRRREKPHYEGEPTLLRVMLRPKWIAALLLALLVAGGFAWLGQWQLSHAVRLDHEQTVDSEAVREIVEVTSAGESVSDGAAGMVVQTRGSFVPGDFSIIEQRRHGEHLGVWVVGHLESPGETAVVGEGSGSDSGEGSGSGEGAGDDSGHLAVALGWAPDTGAAERALTQIDAQLSGSEILLEGRYMPSDGPMAPTADDDPWRLLSMAPAQLVNLWEPFDGAAYAGYLVAHPGDPLSEKVLASYGLEAIDSVPPLPVESINWLNLFYAVEWVVFAGFAVFFWFRLTRDDWEKIHELQQLRASEVA